MVDQPDVGRLVDRLDLRLTQVEAGLAGMRQDMRDALDRLEGTVNRLAFVDMGLYKSEQRAQDKQIADTAALIASVEQRLNDRVDDTNTRVTWLLGLLISALVIALAGGLVRLALG